MKWFVSQQAPSGIVDLARTISGTLPASVCSARAPSSQPLLLFMAAPWLEWTAKYPPP